MKNLIYLFILIPFLGFTQVGTIPVYETDSTFEGTNLQYDATLGVNSAPTEAQVTTKATQQPSRVLNVVPLQTFDSNANWIEGAGWTISGGAATSTFATGNLTYTGSLTITPGNAYEITYTTTWASNQVKISIGDVFYLDPGVSGSFTRTVVLKPTSATGGFRMIPHGVFSGTIDNITVHEITNPATIHLANQLSSSNALYGQVRVPNSTSYFIGGGGEFSTGYYNTAITGLNNNTTGNFNTALGSALTSNTTGWSNTAMGYGALTLNNTGSNNTSLGYNAGARIASGGSNTSPTNSTFIGYDTRSSAIGASNETVLGYLAIGKGSNTVTLGNSSVTVVYIAGKVGWFNGTGSPEGVVTAPSGSLYTNTSGSGTALYVKQSGTGNVGWIAK